MSPRVPIRYGWTFSSLAALVAVIVVCEGCIGGPQQKTQQIEDRLDGSRAVFSGYYQNGRAIEHGKCVVYFDNGVRCEMHYEHGSAEGNCKWYYADGNLAFEGTYRENRPWDGIAITLGMCNGEPHIYRSGEDCGPWKDPKRIFVDE